MAKWNEEEVQEKSKSSGAFVKKEQTESRKSLPEVLEMAGVVERERVVLLLEEGAALKKELDVKVPNSKSARLDDIKNELTMIQQTNNLEGLRHGKFVFVARYQDGRTSIDQKVLVQKLLGLGVKAEVIKEAQEQATKQGANFWVRELEILEG